MASAAPGRASEASGSETYTGCDSPARSHDARPPAATLPTRPTPPHWHETVQSSPSVSSLSAISKTDLCSFPPNKLGSEVAWITSGARPHYKVKTPSADITATVGEHDVYGTSGRHFYGMRLLKAHFPGWPEVAPMTVLRRTRGALRSENHPASLVLETTLRCKRFAGWIEAKDGSGTTIELVSRYHLTGRPPTLRFSLKTGKLQRSECAFAGVDRKSLI